MGRALVVLLLPQSCRVTCASKCLGVSHGLSTLSRLLWPLLLFRLVVPALVLGGVNSPSPLQRQPGFCGFAVPSIICPTSRLRGCSPLHHSPCTTDFIILIILPFSSPFPSLRGFEGSKPFLMLGERLPCPLSPGGPRTRLAAGGAPSELWGTTTYLIPESCAAGCFKLCSSAASSSLITACNFSSTMSE